MIIPEFYASIPRKQERTPIRPAPEKRDASTVMTNNCLHKENRIKPSLKPIKINKMLAHSKFNLNNQT